MKTQPLRSIDFNGKRRLVAVLLSFLCLSLLVFTPGAAQLRNQRRVTAIQLGGASAGSRVTVVSDTALSDYEAFRRGDRFYLKLPLADFDSVAPRFRADGFEEVQVQKTSDGLILSFKLQPGATARVDQHGNRLDVVFTAPNRSLSNNSASSDSATPGSEKPSLSRDGAGPTPFDGASSYRERFVSARPGSGNRGRWRTAPESQPKPRAYTAKNSLETVNKNSQGTGNKNPSEIASKLQAPKVAAASPSPKRSPAAVSSPGVSAAYQPLKTASPGLSTTPQPAVGATNPVGSGKQGNFQSAARQWISSNRLATLLGALILLSLIAYIVMAIRQRQVDGERARLSKTPKVQPRYSPDEQLGNLNVEADELSSRESVSHTPLTKAAVAGTPAERVPGILTMPTIVTPSVAPAEPIEEEEDREVFEL